MYPKNAATPPPIFATVVKAADGTAITSGVAAKYSYAAGSQAAGGGTCQHEGNGQWSYTPTQAETNKISFGIQFYHADAVGSGPTVTVVTMPVNATTVLPSVDMGYINGHSIAGTSSQVADGFEAFFNVATPVQTVAATGIKADVTQILGTALTETSGGYLAAGVKKFFDVATPTQTVAATGIWANVTKWFGTDVTLDPVTNKPDVNAFSIRNASVAADMANVADFFDGTGYAGGTAKLQVDVVKINGTAITGTSTQVADGFTTFFNVASPTQTVAATGIKADVTAISGDATAADNCELMFDGTGYAGGSTKLGVSLVEINAHSIAGTSTQVADGFEAFFNVATPGQTIAATGIKADMTAVSGDTTAADNLETMLDGTGGQALTATFTGNLSGTIGGMTAAALKDFFDTDSTTTYASAVSGSVVKEIADNAGGSALTEAGIADAVWDEAAADHDTALSMGALMNDAGAAGDPWAVTLPGGYGADTAGKILYDNLDTPVSGCAIAGDAMTLTVGERGSIADAVLDDDGVARTGLIPLALDGTLSEIQTDVTTILDRIGAFLGSGVNTIKGFFQALFRKDATLPSDIGGTYAVATDSLEAAAEALAVVDANVDATLAAVDTEIGTLTSNLATVDGIVDTIAATVAKLDTALELDGAVYRFTTNALEQSVASVDTLAIAQAVLSVDVDDVEATAPVDSLAGLILAAFHSNTVDNPGHLTVYRTNDSTVFATWAQTTDATAAPTTGLSTDI